MKKEQSCKGFINGFAALAELPFLRFEVIRTEKHHGFPAAFSELYAARSNGLFVNITRVLAT